MIVAIMQKRGAPCPRFYNRAGYYTSPTLRKNFNSNLRKIKGFPVANLIVNPVQKM